jgi:hypothetical protein
MELDTQAQALTQALTWGAVSLSEVISWADDQIVQSQIPSEALISLSLSDSIPKAVSSLNTLSANPNFSESSRLVFRYFRHGLQSDLVSYEAVSEALFKMALAHQIPDPKAEGLMLSFWDELDLANAGTFGDPVVIKTELLEFLLQYAA